MIATYYVHDDPSMEGSEGLLAILLKRDPGLKLGNGTHFLTKPDQPMQVGILSLGAHATVAPHIHNESKRTVLQTQEALFVQSGKVYIEIYNSQGESRHVCILGSGEMAILLAGGHSLLALEESVIVELKTGPYLGRDADKRPLNVF